MSYKLFDAAGKELLYNDLQDKSRWCKDGEEIEFGFVREYGQVTGLDINPEKATDRFAPDLINLRNGSRGDLKFQSTPFFKAKSLYRIDPTYAVVFNEKDQIRYASKYPDLEIYFWVNWIAVKFEMGSTVVTVEPLTGVWKTEFREFNKYLSSRPLHSYQQRVYDTKGNAKGSFVCDIRDSIFERIV